MGREIRSSLSFLQLNLFIFLLVLSPSSSLTPKPRPPPPPLGHGPPAPALFIFGDSFFDVGNNNYIDTTTLDQANFWPYGETFFHYPTGRFSDGRLVPDFIAEKARLPFIPPFLQPGASHHAGVNFASAGAGALVETFRGSVIDLKSQMRGFGKVESQLVQRLGKSKARSKLSKAVYMFCIGSNDYMSPFLTNSTHLFASYSKRAYVGMVVGNLTTVVKEIYEKGGRRFGFINLPPLGCLPGLRLIGAWNNGSCFEEPSWLADLHNTALLTRLDVLKDQLRGFRYSLYDFNAFLRHRIDHPSKYGFAEARGGCCGTGMYQGVFSCGGRRTVKEYQLCEDPSRHLFWDSYHLTERAYQQLAEELWSGKGNKSNLKDLFQGF
ncbi:hypothetical protein SAY87_029114 [Trapa incisa]|uniref:GDSL esterase/lipase 5 n=1 Tax=Trapa incisa TaxID=236973 RepID=A0AAN7QSP1_9MYRT|nr:hypothetical protein SAY87_029114 [Trapa incisa]